MVTESGPLHPWPAREDPERVREVTVRRYADGGAIDALDEVAAEEPLEIRIAGRSLAVIMRTPGHDHYLAAGFLLGEGIIHDADDIVSCAFGLDRDGFPQRNVLDLRLRPELEESDSLCRRNFVVSSSCGVCGTASIEAVRARVDPLPPRRWTFPSVLLGLEAKLRASQGVFARTGGLHAAGLFDCQGNLLVAHEDVGRHNAVDKALGQMLLQRQLPSGDGIVDGILMVSGRASFELLQKAALAAVPIFVAVGAPSSLAIEMAASTNVTLVGLLRSNRFVVYTSPDRIRLDQVASIPAW
jgi:FdhD protein